MDLLLFVEPAGPGGARFTTVSDPVAAARAEPAGRVRTTTTSDPVAAALLPSTMSLSLVGGSSKLGPAECTCAGPALERESSRPSGASDNKMNHHTNHLEMC